MNAAEMEAFEFLDFGILTDGELDLVLFETQPGQPEVDWVPTYCFEIREHGKAEHVGDINLRVGTGRRIYYGGNIGYEIDEEYQGRGYAGKACRILAPLARAHGMDHLWITSQPGNRASCRTAEKLGAVLRETVELPKDSDMYYGGTHLKRRYRWDIRGFAPLTRERPVMGLLGD